MSSITIYHNPRCSKSRQALAILQESHDVEVYEYLKQGLEQEQVKRLFTATELDSVHKLLRVKEKEYQLANLSPDSNQEQVIAAISEYPKLLERPIVELNGKAIIARPPELVHDLLSK